jgi:hypothetical protein
MLLSLFDQAQSFVLFLHFKLQVWLLHFNLGDCYMSFTLLCKLQALMIIVVIHASNFVVAFEFQLTMCFKF